MSRLPFDRDTWLDLAVNLFPLGILLFFVGLFLVVRPWGFDPGRSLISLGLVVVPFLVLAVVTYYAGRAVFQAEQAE